MILPPKPFGSSGRNLGYSLRLDRTHRDSWLSVDSCCDQAKSNPNANRPVWPDRIRNGDVTSVKFVIPVEHPSTCGGGSNHNTEGESR